MSKATIKIVSEETGAYLSKPILGHSEYAEGIVIIIEYTTAIEEWLIGFGEYGAFHLFSFEFDFNNEKPIVIQTGYIIAATSAILETGEAGIELRLRFNTNVDIH